MPSVIVSPTSLGQSGCIAAVVPAVVHLKNKPLLFKAVDRLITPKAIAVLAAHAATAIMVLPPLQKLQL